MNDPIELAVVEFNDGTFAMVRGDWVEIVNVSKRLTRVLESNKRAAFYSHKSYKCTFGGSGIFIHRTVI